MVVVQGNTASPFAIGASITNNGTVSIGLTKGGPGELVLTGSNTFTGPISVSAGTLQMGDGTPGHDSLLAGNIANNGTVIVNLNGSQSYGGTISGGGSVVKGGTGTLTLTTNDLRWGTTPQGTWLQGVTPLPVGGEAIRSTPNRTSLSLTSSTHGLEQP